MAKSRTGTKQTFIRTTGSADTQLRDVGFAATGSPTPHQGFGSAVVITQRSPVRHETLNLVKASPEPGRINDAM